MNTKPLRVGLLLNSLDVPAWNFELLERLTEAPWCELRLIVRNSADRPPRRLTTRLRSAQRHLGYALYTKWDELRHGKQCRPDAFARKSIEELVDGVPVIDVQPRQTKFSDFIEGQELHEIEAAELDVLIRWGFRILRGKILTAAKYGVWSFHHGDSTVNRGGMPGFWEVMRADPTTGSVLQVLSEQLDAGTVIDTHLGATEFESVRLNQHNLYWKTAPMLLSNLQRLHAERDEFLARKREQSTSTLQPYCQPLRHMPTNRQVLGGVTKMAQRFVAAKAQHLLHYDQWFLAFRIRKRADDANLAFYQYKTILPPKHLFWADPFVVERHGRYYVFLEEYVYATDRAHLAVMEIDAQGNWSEPRTIIKQPYHLSYPFVFEYEGELWMIPETSQNRTIEMYRCTEFPDKWEPVSTLMHDVSAVDTTLYEQDGQWWMFVCLAEKGLRNRDTLYLFHANSPHGPWTPHRENPVKRDVRSARPAGHLFQRDGKLYRPAQDCAVRYGAATTINEVVELNERTYREREVAQITPDWDPRVIGTHTINSAGDLTIIDGEMLRSRFF